MVRRPLRLVLDFGKVVSLFCDKGGGGGKCVSAGVTWGPTGFRGGIYVLRGPTAVVPDVWDRDVVVMTICGRAGTK